MAGAIPFLTKERAAAAPEPRTAGLRLTAGTRTLAVNGKPARVFGLIGPKGNPGITLSPGERFHVDLVNQAGTPHHALARPVAALDAGRLPLAANATDPGW
jgi:hypothetical protein